jgi:hypothetical protein
MCIKSEITPLTQNTTGTKMKLSGWWKKRSLKNANVKKVTVWESTWLPN